MSNEQKPVIDRHENNPHSYWDPTTRLEEVANSLHRIKDLLHTLTALDSSDITIMRTSAVASVFYCAYDLVSSELKEVESIVDALFREMRKEGGPQP